MRNPILFFLVFILLFFSGCELFEKEEEDPLEGYEFEYYTNPTDPALFTVTDYEGYKLTYWGDRDQEGNPESFNKVSMQIPGEEGEVVLYLDADKRPEIIYAPNGATFEFDWTSETTFRLNAISTTGEVQVSIPIYLDSIYTKKSYVQPEIITNPFPVRSTIKNNINVRNYDLSGRGDHKSLQETNADIQVNIMKCGKPIKNALITMTVDPPIGKNNPLSNNNKDGSYYFEIPKADQNEPDYIKKCEKIAGIIDSVCKYWILIRVTAFFIGEKTICDKIKNEIQTSFPNATDQSITQYSKLAFKILPKLCEFREKMNEKGVSMEEICLKTYLFNAEPKPINYTFTLHVQIPGQKSFSTDPVGFDPNITTAWDIEAPSEISIEKLTTEPSDPGPGQGYTIVAVLLCPDPQGTDVTISISGDDGYSNSLTTTITQSSELTLFVPGGKEGVRDAIAVQVTG